jgi:undecaprenyl pyrophosphate phosphatase UppP
VVGGRPGGARRRSGRPREAACAGSRRSRRSSPGVSRSGATLTALRLAGVEREAAQRFTLLLSLPVTAGRRGLTLARTPRAGWLRRCAPCAPGAVTAALAGATTVTVPTGTDGAWSGRALYRLGLAAVIARQLRRRGEP